MLATVPSLLSMLALAAQLQPTTQSPVVSHGQLSGGRYPTREIAGVNVIDTPIVRAAEVIARDHSGGEFGYMHVMRTWLFGSLIIAKNETLRRTVDLEVHAVAVLLHDLGWDTTTDSQYVSHDKRFEVDGAIAAREFIRAHEDGGNWDEYRVQQVWDAIALHAEDTPFPYKEPVVASTGYGIMMDFRAPDLGVTQEDWDMIVAEYPRDGVVAGFLDTITRLCKTKPTSTYDSWQQPFGELLVDGYNATGYRNIDVVLSAAK